MEGGSGRRIKGSRPAWTTYIGRVSKANKITNKINEDFRAKARKLSWFNSYLPLQERFNYDICTGSLFTAFDPHNPANLLKLRLFH